MDREQKITYARRYAADLVEQHEGIAGIFLGGSVARGNDLPISDIDLWCFTDDSHLPLPIKKHADGDLYVDIEQRPASELTQIDLSNDSYFCGYVHDALVLHDRDGNLRKCQKRAQEHLFSGPHRETQLASVRESVESNRRKLVASAQAQDACEACRTSIFAAWSLCDYMLVAKGISPGGARGIARLQVAWPEAAEELVTFEGMADLGQVRIAHLIDTYRRIADRGSLFTMWFKKVEWMLANGYRTDALHALWIALGLRIKEATTRDIGVSPADLQQRCLRWMDTIGWDWGTVNSKSNELQGLMDRFCQ